MLDGQTNVLREKAEAFATRIINMLGYLRLRHVEPFIVNQVGRAGTSIGANISESRSAQSRADFINKLKIALKEADETKFWLGQLYATKGISEIEHSSMNADLMELIYLLNAIIKKTLANGL